VVNNDYEVEFINPAMERDFGVLKGYKCYNYFYGRSEICQKCKIQQAFQGDTIEWEQYSSRLDKTYEALATPIINIDGSVSVVLILNDVTERKEAEDGIHRSRESFRTLAENSPDLIIRLDKNLRYVYVNSVITEMTGKSPEYYIGKTYEEAGIPEEYATIWREHNLKAIETGEIQHYEFEFSTINGLRFVETTAIPEFNANGEIESIIILDRDITERKEIEEQLKKLIEDLKRSNKELRQFAYVSSHDLQEPLRTIASFTQLLQMRYKGRLDGDADEFMGYIVEASIRMKQQILDLLDYSRVGTKSGEFGLVDTNEVLNKIIKSLHISITEAGAEITYGELPNVMGDAGQLEKIFQNLISNAIKFRKCEEPLKIDISAYKSEDEKEYVFSVSDNGIGIEEQYFERIFTIFQRLHTRDVYKGTGIGLSIIKRIIDRHGGHIWVESSFGDGSTFYFTIPTEIQ
jgi:PAS domain S-box-containing protein